MPPNFEVDHESKILIFVSATSSLQLTNLLLDAFNFELCLRKLALSEQRIVRDTRHNSVKALVLRLFSKYVLNYSLFVSGEHASFKPWDELELLFNGYGKPKLGRLDSSKIEFNSSSSNNLASITVQFNSDSPVGIDLSHESQDSISSTDFMLQFQGIFTRAEIDQLESIDDVHLKYCTFNHFWTLKEAFAKFLGTGLNIDLTSFGFQLGNHLAFQKDKTTPSSGSRELDWHHDITVDIGDLPEDIRKDIQTKPIKCSSTILQPSSGQLLPVIMSVVHQTNVEHYQCIQIDMEKIVKGIIDGNESYQV
ncbi:hypothetical protein PUMCH_005060 [Australozyma saopauloensis]|uniref:holo-[acyl-carrier-protein] synthase n=1 Tax=Australozyma saopauloensis TaxID=291208 RepID=A0AAX4HGN4_9ASCO|nr:hypothetical protein PUMCH_005060 [[Candida] saopauloensis]